MLVRNCSFNAETTTVGHARLKPQPHLPSYGIARMLMLALKLCSEVLRLRGFMNNG